MAAAALPLRPPVQNAPWEEVVAYIDAMPGVPSWKQIEAEVDAHTRPDVDAQVLPHIAERKAYAQRHGYAEPTRFYRQEDDVLARTRWMFHLGKLYPRVYNVIRATAAGLADIGNRSITVWLLVTCFPSEWTMHIDTLAEALNAASSRDYGRPTYAMQRLSFAHAKALLRQLDAMRSDPTQSYLLAWSEVVRMRRTLEDMVTRDRTNLAHSGLIDRLALRDADAAQYLARFIAPDAITVAHPLRIRQHASQMQEMRANMSDADRPDAVLARVTRATAGRAGGLAVGDATTTNQQYLESILGVMRTPGQDPAVTLGRARAMLDTLMQSIDDAAPPPAQLPSPSSSSSPSPLSLPPATHW